MERLFAIFCASAAVITVTAMSQWAFTTHSHNTQTEPSVFSSENNRSKRLSALTVSTQKSLDISSKSHNIDAHKTTHSMANLYSAGSDLQATQQHEVTANKSYGLFQTLNINSLLANEGINLPGIDDTTTHASGLHYVLYEQSSITTERALDIIIGDWIKQDPAAAWWWLEANDVTGVLDRYRNAIVQHWLAIDSNSALLAITGLPTSSKKEHLLATYAAHVAIHEPEKAFYWAYALQDENERRQALDSVVYQWASSDPEQVIMHIDNIIEPTLREQLLYQAGPSITAALTKIDPLRAMLWTDSLNSDENQFLSPIAFQQWINKNPEDALNWLSATKTGTDSDIYMTTVAGTLAYQDLPTAVNIFPTLSEQVQTDMAASIAFGLYQESPIDAQVWTNNISNPKVHLSASRGMLVATVDDEPELALQLAIEYSAQDQTEVLVSTALEVDQQHPYLLESWLLTAPLTSEQHTDILGALVRQPTE